VNDESYSFPYLHMWVIIFEYFNVRWHFSSLQNVTFLLFGDCDSFHSFFFFFFLLLNVREENILPHPSASRLRQAASRQRGRPKVYHFSLAARRRRCHDSCCSKLREQSVWWVPLQCIHRKSCRFHASCDLQRWFIPVHEYRNSYGLKIWNAIWLPCVHYL